MIVPKYTREIPQRYRLETKKCCQCGYVAFPPRLVCPECQSQEFEFIKLKPEGKIITFTIIRIPSDQFSRQAPFAVAIIETVDGARLTTQVVDCKLEDIEIGKSVRLIFRRIQKEGKSGILQYGYKAILM